MQEHVRRTPTYIIEVFHLKDAASEQAMAVELWFDSIGQDFFEQSRVFLANGRIQ